MAEQQIKDEDLNLVEDKDGSYTISGLGAEDEELTKETEAPDSEEGEERIAATHEEEHDDEGAHAGETADEAEARRQRNRHNRQESKRRRQEAFERLQRELEAERSVRAGLEQRLAVVERKSTGSEMAQLEQVEREAVQHYNYFKNINAKAIEAADGTTAIDAQEKMFAARQRLQQVANIKRAMQQNQIQPQPLDPRLVSHATSWMDKNKWYDPSGNNEDSTVVLAIDRRMGQEGFDPTTPEYWKELDSRVKKYLPHRSSSGYNRPQDTGGTLNRQKAPVAGSDREATSSAGKGAYRLSAERVQALKDAGKWDDPAARAKAIRAYQQYDKENAQ